MFCTHVRNVRLWSSVLGVIFVGSSSRIAPENRGVHSCAAAHPGGPGVPRLGGGALTACTQTSSDLQHYFIKHVNRPVYYTDAA